MVWVGGLERFRLIGLPITKGGALVGQGGEGHDCTAGTGTQGEKGHDELVGKRR